MKLPFIRDDALPRHDDHPDTGCDLHDSCLTCPFERCRYDVEGGVPSLLRVERDAAIVRARLNERLTAAQIGDRFGLSIRSVYRILAEGNHG